MSNKRIYSVFIFFLFYNLFGQTYFPGGVAGAETWYIVNHDDLGYLNYPNLGDRFIKIQRCHDFSFVPRLFNFNHSIQTNNLCISYDAPLENTTSRNVFFVSEPLLEGNNTPPAAQNLSHLTSGWRPGIPNLNVNDTIQNRFDLANKSVYINKKITGFSSINNANINFYNWNIYQQDKKIKSYGLTGETTFYIGKNFTTSLPAGNSFKGNFPEFISFPFELTANQKNRVESYLALKYGITLAENIPYRNSKNKVFWAANNYTKFGNCIFGIGRDDISGLNQLQSESVHNKGYLIASVEELLETNLEKQQLVSIENNNFIVFGDNGAVDKLKPENAAHVSALAKVWLSQSTGETAHTANINFRFALYDAIKQALSENPNLKLWMLHDKNANNQTISNFNNQYVEYYEASDMIGVDVGFFSNVYFDTDKLTYDQFTFGVGPEMIVQVRYDLGDCDKNSVNSSVVITGGISPYKVDIKNENGYSEIFDIQEAILPFTAIAPDTYTVTVTDAAGDQASVTIDVEQPQIVLELGPDIALTAAQPITLDAGQNVIDPTATYQWYLNGVILENYGSVLTVSRPGQYTVTVTSGNRMCQQTDTILIYYNWEVADWTFCSETGIMAISQEGIPPFTSVLSGPSQTVTEVYNDFEEHSFSGLEFGEYTITTYDQNGELFTIQFEMVNPFEGIDINLASQLQQQACIPAQYTGSAPSFGCTTTISLDASLDVTSSNIASYEWFMNGQPTGIFTPNVELTVNNNIPTGPGGFNEFSVVVTTNNSCSISKAIAVTKSYTINASTTNVTISRLAAKTDAAPLAEESKNKLTAKVYPNPSKPNSTFYYEVSSGEVFNGVVEIYSPTGALLQSFKLTGNSNYTLPLTLFTSGTYLICTKTGATTVTNKIIIN